MPKAVANDYGEVGLIDTPSARMASDASLTTTLAFDRAFDSYAITYQALPWLEATFRYSGSAEVSFFNDRTYWDRNYGFKARLIDETQYLPALAVGVRDLIGTGVFGSEYVVGSKQFDKWDATLGLAWGRLAGNGQFSNPLNVFNDKFDFRDPPSSDVANAGTVRNYYFRGDAGLFGGIAYQYNDQLRLMAEINPDEYDFTERSDGSSIDPSSPLSVGLEWKYSDQITVGASFQHLDQLGISVTATFDTAADPKRRPSPNYISSFYLPQSSLPTQIDKANWYQRLLYDAERHDLFLVEGTISPDGRVAKLVVGNAYYPLWADALGKHLALADLHLPPEVITIHFVAEEAGHRSATIIVPRPSTSLYDGEMMARSSIEDGQTLSGPQERTNFSTGRVISDIGIGQQIQLFDPDDPFRFQINLRLDSEYALNNHWSIRSSLFFDLYNNFDNSQRRESDSKLPKVRTDIVKYLTEGKSGLEKLILEGRDTYGTNLHYRVFGGVLEGMYSGFGGEVLYWDTESRIAFGLSAAAVKKRDFDRGFQHLDYETITGFASLYWATPWHNYDAALHVGRYLAKDIGATVDLRRTFRNGWQVGIFATITDVPSEVFGEGSFDKGFFFQIPLNGLFGNEGRGVNATRIRPVLRDGGQRLEDYSGNIFWDLRQSRFDSFKKDARLFP